MANPPKADGNRTEILIMVLILGGKHYVLIIPFHTLGLRLLCNWYYPIWENFILSTSFAPKLKPQCK